MFCWPETRNQKPETRNKKSPTQKHLQLTFGLSTISWCYTKNSCCDYSSLSIVLVPDNVYCCYCGWWLCSLHPTFQHHESINILLSKSFITFATTDVVIDCFNDIILYSVRDHKVRSRSKLRLDQSLHLCWEPKKESFINPSESIILVPLVIISFPFMYKKSIMNNHIRNKKPQPTINFRKVECSHLILHYK